MISDQTEKFLSALAESISISGTMIDRAKESYEAVGKAKGILTALKNALYVSEQLMIKLL